MKKLLILENSPSRNLEFITKVKVDYPEDVIVRTSSQECIEELQVQECRGNSFGLICFGDEDVTDFDMTLAQYLRLTQNHDCAKTVTHTWNTKRAEGIKELLPNTFYFPYCQSYVGFLNNYPISDSGK